VPSLRELQRAFGAALAERAVTDGIASQVVANGIDPAARLRIYRNNSREGFLATLRAAFPVLERLVGEDYFRQLAFEYRAQFPSTSGNLHHVGARLTGYLQQRFATTEYAYFADVARLESALQEAMVAADHRPLDLSSLRGVAENQYDRLAFMLHPAARLVSSPFPVLTIWNANQPEADAAQTIDLASGTERVLVLRTSEGVELRRLDTAEFAFLAALGAGRALASAIEAANGTMDEAGAATEGPGFDAATVLQRCVAAGAIVDFHLIGDSQ